MDLPADFDVQPMVQTLENFVQQTQPHNDSSGNFFTTSSSPACGRERAIELTETVRPLLDRLLPGWEEEETSDPGFEFAVVHDAAMRLRARLLSRQEVASLLSGLDQAPALRADSLHPAVWQAASVQWNTGHHHEAVLAAAKAVNSRLQARLGRRDVSDVQLVREAFGTGAASAERRRLRAPDVLDDQTRSSLQQGALSFGVGCFQAIRNPVGHLPNEEHELGEQAALERLAAFSLLARWVDEFEMASE